MEDEYEGSGYQGKLSTLALDAIVKQLNERFTTTNLVTVRSQGTGGTLSENLRLVDRIMDRRAMFHNLVEANPIMQKPYQDAVRYQTDRPRAIHSLLKPRLTENKYKMIAQEPRPTAALNKIKESLETVFNTGMAQVEDRQSLDVQGFIADGQIIDCYGVLHWSKAEHLYPEVPDYEWVDEPPDDDDEAARFEPYTKKRGGKGKYRETDKSLQARHQQAKARVGFPWFIDVIHPANIRWLEDRGCANGLGMVLHMRQVQVLDYNQELEKEGKALALDALSGDKKLRIYGAATAPEWATPSQGGQLIDVATLWTRDECYELAKLTGGGSATSGWTIIKCFAHPYKMPPFVIIPAIEINDPDPALRYSPALEGVYRLAKMYNRVMTLLMVIAEMIALPLYYLENTATSAPKLAEDGSLMTFSRDSALAEKIPAGYTLKRVEYEINPAFVQTVQYLHEALKEAEPSTGQADTTSATKPWTARIQMAQAAVQPTHLVRNIERGMTVMAMNMLMVHQLPPEEGGFADDVAVYPRGKDGKVDRSKTISINWKELSGFTIEAEIQKITAAERITMMEHGMELMKNQVITDLEFIEDFEGKANATDVYAERQGWAAFKQLMMPGIVKQRLAAYMGAKYVLGMNGEMVGPDGNPAAPEQVLAANGYQMQAPTAPGGGLPVGATMNGTAPSPPPRPPAPPQGPQGGPQPMPSLNVPGMDRVTSLT